MGKYTKNKTEQLDEVSKEKMGSYALGALKSRENASKTHNDASAKRFKSISHLSRAAKNGPDKDYGETDQNHAERMGRLDRRVKTADKDMKDAHLTLTKRNKGLNMVGRKLAKEEVLNEAEEALLESITDDDLEQLDELSKKTLGSYVNKAATSAATHAQNYGKKKAEGDEVERFTNRNGMTNNPNDFKHQNTIKSAIGADDHSVNKSLRTASKRLKGISRAVGKLTKEDVDPNVATEVDALAPGPQQSTLSTAGITQRNLSMEAQIAAIMAAGPDPRADYEKARNLILWEPEQQTDWSQVEQGKMSSHDYISKWKNKG